MPDRPALPWIKSLAASPIGVNAATSDRLPTFHQCLWQWPVTHAGTTALMTARTGRFRHLRHLASAVDARNMPTRANAIATDFKSTSLRGFMGV
jgi:hypothetical protein